jgi:hypothetical protein
MAKRRGRGEGSIYRRKDGSWVAQYTVGDKRRYIYGKTRKDVAARLSKAIAERDSGFVYDSENLKVADYLDRWLDAIRDTLRKRTWQRHEEITRLHLKPTIGSVKLDKLDPFQVQTLYRSKINSGLSPRTVQIIHATLYKALKQAVRWSLVPHRSRINLRHLRRPPRHQNHSKVNRGHKSHHHPKSQPQSHHRLQSQHHNQLLLYLQVLPWICGAGRKSGISGSSVGSEVKIPVLWVPLITKWQLTKQLMGNRCTAH